MPKSIYITDVIVLPIANWDQPCSTAEQQRVILALESGDVLLFPQLHFPIQDGEERLLSPIAAGQAKNVSLDSSSGALGGSDTNEAELKLLRSMMTRFATLSRALIHNVFPRYGRTYSGHAPATDLLRLLGV